MLRILKQHWPILAAVSILLAIVLVLLCLSVKQNEGHLVYALDDAYIHMAMAKNMAQHGVWGVTRHAFSPSTSSILWTLILSLCYFILGTHETIPLILNIIFALLALVLVQRILNQTSLAGACKFLLLLSIILFTSLPAVIFVGMEHAAQILIDILFAHQAALVLARGRPDTSERDSRLLLLLSALVPLIRYEGLFLITVVCLLLLARGRVLMAFASGALAVIPIAVFGFISVRQGAFWLPNSVLLKGMDPAHGPIALLDHALAQLKAAPYLWQLLLLAAALYFIRRKAGRETWEREQSLLCIFIFTTLLHVTFSLVLVWFYRYEAYLVALGLLACGVSLRDVLNVRMLRSRDAISLVKFAALALMVSLCVVSLAGRGVVVLRQTPRATTNIYQQQYQMALFLRRYYEGSAIAANDIGAINYFADIECLDLWGLATTEVARAKREGKYDTRLIRALGERSRAKIAIVYESWLNEYGGVPVEWSPVGRWRIPENIVCRDDTVSFYALDASETEHLIRSLRDFAPHLPKGVEQAGMIGRFPQYFGQRIDFRAAESDQYLWYGWSGREACCRWSNAGRAAIIFNVDDSRPNKLLMKIGPFLSPGRVDGQRVEIELNGRNLATLELKERESRVYSIDFSDALLREDNVLILKLPDAVAPASLKMSDDARQLGINLEWLEMKTESAR
ncbi:MAG: hypothetical protein QOD00_1755 [Blastocatellia bacterium]|jgi:hypothetical protein|nr:hypothetical protein [Blastocatellia bacterium]